MYDSPGAFESYITDTSVHSSNYRCWTIHGTHNITIERNIAYDIEGHCFYLEDGVEENNTIQYNAIAHVHPIGRAAAGSCAGEYICSGCDSSWLEYPISNVEGDSDLYIFDTSELLVPADTTAGPFYVTNTQNNWIGNIARYM